MDLNKNEMPPEDEEPLLDVKKVFVLHDHPARGVFEFRPRVKSKYVKFCFVPLCPNTSVATPEKMFITVPVNPVRRKVWLDAVGRPATKNPKSPLFCCQDHFNLENEMRNYDEFLKVGKVSMALSRDAVPHLFMCNEFEHLRRKERIEILRKLHQQNEITIIPNKVRRTTEPKNQETDHESKLPNAVFIQVPKFKTEVNRDLCNIAETIVIDDDSD